MKVLFIVVMALVWWALAVTSAAWLVTVLAQSAHLPLIGGAMQWLVLVGFTLMFLGGMAANAYIGWIMRHKDGE